MKWLGAIGAAAAGLVLAWTGGSFFLNGGVSTMEVVPWGLVLLAALMMSLGGHQPVSRAKQHSDFCVFQLGNYGLSARADVDRGELWRLSRRVRAPSPLP